MGTKQQQSKSAQAGVDAAQDSVRAQEISVDEVIPPGARTEADGPSKDPFAEVVAYLLDDFIPIPGTNFRIGLDPIVGLLPGMGDLFTNAAGGSLLVAGARAGVPRVILLRMTLNTAINLLFGAVPIVGDAFSAWFKSNRRNYNLLMRYGYGVDPEQRKKARRKATWVDWLLVFFLLAFLAAVLVTVVFIAYKILAFIWSWIAGLFGGQETIR